jgi:LPXTG-motif cell wall-anchored protein
MNMLRIRHLTALLTALALAVPVGAAAQGSAGDNGYKDPFPASNPPGHHKRNSSTRRTGGSTPASSPPLTASGPGAANPSPAGSAGTTSATGSSGSSGGSGTLPRTGLDVIMFAVVGAILLLSGVVVRRGARES